MVIFSKGMKNLKYAGREEGLTILSKKKYSLSNHCGGLLGVYDALTVALFKGHVSMVRLRDK